MDAKNLRLSQDSTGTYHISGTINGQRIRLSTGTKDKHEAKLFAVRKELELLYEAVGKANGYIKSVTFGECTKRYEKDVRYNRKNQGIVERLKRRFGNETITNIDQDKVDVFISTELKGLALSTIDRNMTVFNAIRNHAVRVKLVERDHLPYIHTEKPSKHDHRMHVVNVETRDKIIEQAREPYADLFTFLFYTGARVGCALSRTWRDRVQPGMRLYTNKGGRGKLRKCREYYVPEVQELTSMLNRRLKQAMDDPGWRDTDKIFDVSYTSVRNELARVCEILGIEDFLLHDIRHCFGTYLALNKQGIEVIADLMGHDSLESARVYINYSTDELKRQMSEALSRPKGNQGNVVYL